MRCWLTIALCCFLYIARSQLSDGHRLYLNNQIHYVNESIHGLLIAHRLFEGYNQEINKYVDLPSHEINHYGNEDLPPDIFDDRNQWFYDKSPKLLYNELLLDARRKQHPIDIWTIISQIRNITTFVNNGRIELGQNIKAGSLNQLTNIQKIYIGLESASEYYEDFAYQVDLLEQILSQPYDNINLEPSRKQVYTALLDIYFDTKNALSQVKKDQESVSDIIGKLDREINWLTSCINQLSSQQEKSELISIREIIQAFSRELKAYEDNNEVPDEYAEYRRGYYFQNVKLLSLVNRYGNGFISEINRFFDRNDWKVIKFIEEPHFVQVIYPKKISQESIGTKKSPPRPRVLVVKESTLPDVQEVDLSKEALKPPVQKVAPPPMHVLSTHSFSVDSVVFDLELFDHRIKDGDLVSINVNGEWLFNDVSLEKKTRRLTLTLNPSGDNYIVIKALNTGWRPPNTLGVRYISNGQANNFYLITDLEANEAIQIRYRLH